MPLSLNFSPNGTPKIVEIPARCRASWLHMRIHCVHKSWEITSMVQNQPGFWSTDKGGAIRDARNNLVATSNVLPVWLLDVPLVPCLSPMFAGSLIFQHFLALTSSCWNKFPPPQFWDLLVVGAEERSRRNKLRHGCCALLSADCCYGAGKWLAHEYCPWVHCGSKLQNSLANSLTPIKKLGGTGYIYKYFYLVQVQYAWCENRKQWVAGYLKLALASNSFYLNNTRNMTQHTRNTWLYWKSRFYWPSFSPPVRPSTLARLRCLQGYPWEHFFLITEKRPKTGHASSASIWLTLVESDTACARLECELRLLGVVYSFSREEAEVSVSVGTQCLDVPSAEL